MLVKIVKPGDIRHSLERRGAVSVQLGHGAQRMLQNARLALKGFIQTFAVIMTQACAYNVLEERGVVEESSRRVFPVLQDYMELRSRNRQLVNPLLVDLVSKAHILHLEHSLAHTVLLDSTLSRIVQLRVMRAPRAHMELSQVLLI
jgi:hypothetical protein